MKKIFLLLIIILISPILSFTVFHSQNLQRIPTIVDSGFDSDYGDYDSSWDSDYDSSWGSSSWYDDDDDDYEYNSSYSGGSSGGSLDSTTATVLLVIFCLVVGTVLVIRLYRVHLKKLERQERNLYKTLYSHYDLSIGQGRDSDLVCLAYTNYEKIQKAWMNRDLEPVRGLLSDEMYNMYQMQVDTLIEDNQINVMSDIEFVGGRVASKRVHKKTEIITVLLCVKCKDYIKDVRKNKVISGSKHATIMYVYSLTFVRDISSMSTTKCPSCGASVKNQMSTTCPYCNNTLLLYSSELTMTNKRIESQFKIKNRRKKWDLRK